MINLTNKPQLVKQKYKIQKNVLHNQMLCRLLPSWPLTVDVVSTDPLLAVSAFR